MADAMLCGRIVTTSGRALVKYTQRSSILFKYRPDCTRTLVANWLIPELNRNLNFLENNRQVEVSVTSLFIRIQSEVME